MTAISRPPYFDDDDSVVFRTNQIVPFGSPVRIEGRQGLWRYVARAGAYIEVVGPYFPTKQSNERSRIFPITDAKYPGRKFKPSDVAASPEVKALSEGAKRGKR